MSNWCVRLLLLFSLFLFVNGKRISARDRNKALAAASGDILTPGPSPTSGTGPTGTPKPSGTPKGTTSRPSRGSTRPNGDIGPTGPTGPGEGGPPADNTYPAGIIGSWSILAQGLPGELIFALDPSGVIYATISLDTSLENTPSQPSSPETVKSLKFFQEMNFYSYWFEFYVASDQTWYEALFDFSLRSFHGSVRDPSKTYPTTFDGVPNRGQNSKDPIDTTIATPHTGTWAILANGWAGQLILSGSAPTDAVGYQGVAAPPHTGTIQVDNSPLPEGQPNPPEDLQSISVVFKFGNWYIKFYRPGPHQWYSMLVRTDRSLHGHFTDDSGYHWSFDGTREFGYLTQHYNETEPPLIGMWTILQYRNYGRLDTNQDVNDDNYYGTMSLYIAGQNTPNLALPNFTFLTKYNAFFCYFQRDTGSVGVFNYYGIVENDYTSMHGHFHSPNFVWPFSFDAS